VLRRYGEIVGLAFQLADDLLDETADAATLGKAAGKDAARGKKTLPALRGIDWTRAELDRLVAEAEGLLAPFGERAGTLRATARFVARRSK
jgi:farnesyl diphosphate synthase